MFTEVNTYAPDEVFLTFGGYTVEGWNSISVKKRVPTFTVVQGIRGKNTRIRNRNTHATIEINVDMTSKLNEVLSDVVSNDKVSGGAVLHLSLMDKSGTEVFNSNEAYVTDDSDRSYDNTLGSRTWTIECLNSTWDGVGSQTGGFSIFDIF
jgi:hypothetical protein